MLVDLFVGFEELFEFPFELRVGNLAGSILVFEFLESGSVSRSEAVDRSPAPPDPASKYGDDEHGDCDEGGERCNVHYHASVL